MQLPQSAWYAWLVGTRGRIIACFLILLSWQAFAAGQSVTKNLPGVDALISRGDLDGAERAVWATLSTNPNDAHALALLGRIRGLQHRLPEAETLFRRASEINPKSSEAQSGLARALALQGKTDAAIDAYRRAQTLAPNDQQLTTELAQLYRDSGKPETALAALQSIPAGRQDEHATLVRIASLIDLGRTGEAITIARSVSAKNPKLNLTLADMFVAAKLPDPALGFLSSAATAGKQLDRVHYLRGKALLEKNQNAAALASFQKSLALNPRAIDSLVAIAEIYSLQGNHTRSFEMMQRVLKADPDSVPTLRHFTVEAMKSGHSAAAADSALQLIARSDNPEDQYLAGAVLLDANQDESALGALQHYVAARPEDAKGWLAFGMANDRLSHADEAVKAYERSLQINPNLAESEFRLGLLSKVQNQPAAATAHFERALQIDPTKFRAFVEAGKIYLQSGQLPHALELLQRAEVLNPNDSETQYNLGLVLSKLGRVEESKQHMARYFQLYENKSPQSQPANGTGKDPGP